MNQINSSLKIITKIPKNNNPKPAITPKSDIFPLFFNFRNENKLTPGNLLPGEFMKVCSQEVKIK